MALVALKRPAGKVAMDKARKALKAGQGKEGEGKGAEEGEGKGAEQKAVDFTACTRAQAFVFEKMLPTFHPKIQEAWRDVINRKGERGICNLKNAIRNKVVRKDASYAISKQNLNEVDVSEVTAFIKTSENSSKDKGVTWSVVQRMYHFNQAQIDEAIEKEHLWCEDGSDGEEYWYERSKERATTEITEETTKVDKKHKPKSEAELKSLVSKAAAQNKAWLRLAMGAMHPKKGSSSGSRVELDPEIDAGVLMKGMQEAWDASTILTSDAGLLAQRVLRDGSESVANHKKARAIMELLVLCTGPAQKVLQFLQHTCDQIDVKAAQKALKECAAPFMQLELAHQELLVDTEVLNKKEKKMALAKRGVTS